jgi:predicted nuclease of predicted toxin-antitoxin system
VSPPSVPAVLFVDRSLGAYQIAAALRAAGAFVVTHDEVFPRDTPDDVWLEEAGRRGWLVLSKDKRIGSRTLELLAIARAGARVFILGAGNMTGQQMAMVFAGALQKVQRLAASEPAPFVARIPRRGPIKVWKRRASLVRLVGRYSR